MIDFDTTYHNDELYDAFRRRKMVRRMDGGRPMRRFPNRPIRRNPRRNIRMQRPPKRQMSGRPIRRKPIQKWTRRAPIKKTRIRPIMPYVPNIKKRVTPPFRRTFPKRPPIKIRKTGGVKPIRPIPVKASPKKKATIKKVILPSKKPKKKKKAKVDYSKWASVSIGGGSRKSPKTPPIKTRIPEQYVSSETDINHQNNNTMNTNVKANTKEEKEDAIKLAAKKKQVRNIALALGTVALLTAVYLASKKKTS